MHMDIDETWHNMMFWKRENEIIPYGGNTGGHLYDLVVVNRHIRFGKGALPENLGLRQ